MVANLLTMGNAVCGFAAVIMICCAARPDAAAPDPTIEYSYYEFKTAAWLILLGMVFDVLDGRVARTTKSTTEIGAQLDSLADMVTFGVAPAVLVFRMPQLLIPEWNAWRWALWCLATAYFLGALLRLARFTAESAPDESAHLCFKGLPSPGAAGAIASAAIFFIYLKEFKQEELALLGPWKEGLQHAASYLLAFLPFIAGILGYLMVSNRLRYVHVAGQIVASHSFDALAYVTFAVILGIIFPEVTLPIFFLVYLSSAPTKLLFQSAPWRKVRAGADPA